MAQTGFTPIQLYSSSTPTNAPSASNLTNDTKGSELAINIADKNLFFKDSTNAVNTVPIRQSGAASDGWLSSTDWNTFNNKQPAGTYVNSVTGTAPVVSSGGTNPAISMAAATTSVNGYLTSTDWNTFNNKQAALVSGTNIKTVNGTTLLGSGDLGTIGVGYGGTGTSTAFTAGSVVFAGASGVYSQDNTNLFWNDANNRLGIGIATPTDRLHVYDGISKVESTVGGSTSAYFYQISPAFTGGSQNKSAYVMETGTRVTDLGFFTNSGGQYGSYLNLGGASQDAGFELRIGGTVRQKVFASGGVSIGNTTDPGAGVLFVSSGVRFPATQVASADANTLDDYEEGTFTPTVIGSTSAGTATYGRQTGRYTKIGRLVTFSIDLDWSSGSGTGDLQFSGLPFTSASGVNTGIPANFVGTITLTANNYLQGWLPGSATTINAMQSAVGGGAISAVAYDAAGSIMLSGSYIV